MKNCWASSTKPFGNGDGGNQKQGAEETIRREVRVPCSGKQEKKRRSRSSLRGNTNPHVGELEKRVALKGKPEKQNGEETNC